MTMVMLDICVQSFTITHTQCFMLIVKYKVICMYSSPEAGCYWLRVCNVAMTRIMLNYMCVQTFMTTHMTNNNL